MAIGDVTLSRSLWTILCDEADQHVATLENELSILQFDPRAVPRAGMVRASHTLCGIHRTGGFPIVATTAKALEQTLIALEQHGAPLPGTAQPMLARAIAGLALFVVAHQGRRRSAQGDVEEAGEIQRELDELRQEAATEAGDAEAAAAAGRTARGRERRRDDGGRDRRRDRRIRGGGRTGAGGACCGRRIPHPGAGAARATDIVLPLAWSTRSPTFATTSMRRCCRSSSTKPRNCFRRRARSCAPGAASADDTAVAQLRRTLHTFKGSARMAGAMRLGELAHLMESRLDGDLRRRRPQLFDALDDDLDHIAFLLDALRARRSQHRAALGRRARRGARRTPPRPEAPAPRRVHRAPAGGRSSRRAARRPPARRSVRRRGPAPASRAVAATPPAPRCARTRAKRPPSSRPARARSCACAPT